MFHHIYIDNYVFIMMDLFYYVQKISLIVQTPYGTMSLKDFGWETYRVRSHSILPSVSNTDNYQSAKRRISKCGTSSSPRKNISLQVTSSSSLPSSSTTTDSSDNTTKYELNKLMSVDVVAAFRLLCLQQFY